MRHNDNPTAGKEQRGLTYIFYGVRISSVQISSKGKNVDNFSVATITRLAQRDGGSVVDLSFTVKIHPHLGANAVVINYPGYNGNIDGYAQKYEKLACRIVEKDVAAVVRMGNEDRLGFLYEESLIGDLRVTIEYVIGNAAKMCATSTPDIYLMGFSAGAGAVAAVAAEYPAVKKILLIAPAGDAGNRNIANLAHFQGEVYVTVGAWDEVVGMHAGEYFMELAKAATKKNLVIVPRCDHQFRGKKNGMVLSKAPLWAFCGDTTYPSSDGGVALYE
jgi:dienelactone hydrolase